MRQIRTAVFLLSVFIAAESHAANYLNLREFLNTTEETWTYNATLTLPYTCKKDVLNHSIHNTFYFNQSVYTSSNKSWEWNITRGVFYYYGQQGKHWSLMFIYDYMTGHTRKEMMFGINGTCAVNKVERLQDTFPPNYELLVKNSSLDRPELLECLKKYEDLANKSRAKYNNTHSYVYGLTVYRRECLTY